MPYILSAKDTKLYNQIIVHVKSCFMEIRKKEKGREDLQAEML